MTAVETFGLWAKENGIQATHVVIAKTDLAGHGLFATAEDAISVTIPSSVHLTAARAQKTHPELASLDDQDDKTLLRLFLAFEKHQTTPAWASYIAILPSSVGSLFEHVDALEGTSLARSVHAKHAALTNEHRQFQALFPWLTLETWTWADAVVRSRAVGIDDDRWVLLPYFDFVNHSLEPNTRWQPQEDGSIVIAPIRPIKAGEELTFSYGQKSNQELLFSYGFTIDKNPEPPRVTIPALGFVDMDGIESQLKMSWLLPAKPVLTLREGEWTRESIELMYLVVLDEEFGLKFLLDDQEQVQLNLGDDQVRDLKDLVDKLGQLEAFPVIQLRVVFLLLNATTSLYEAICAEQDPTPLQTTWMTSHIERYRSEEKSLLQGALERLVSSQDELMHNNVVLEYLAAQEED